MHVDKTDCSEHKFDSAAPALEWLDGALTRRNVKATGDSWGWGSDEKMTVGTKWFSDVFDVFFCISKTVR